MGVTLLPYTLSLVFCPSLIPTSTQTYTSTLTFIHIGSLFLQVLIGNRDWMKQNSVPVPKNVDGQMAEQEELGRTAVLAAINGESCSERKSHPRA